MSNQPMSMQSVVYATTVLAYLALILFIVQVCASQWRKLCKIRCAYIANYAATWSSFWQKNDPLEPQVHKLMAKNHLHRARVGAATFSHICVVYLLGTLAHIHAHPRALTTDHWAWIAVSEWNFIPCTVCLWLSRLCVWFPVMLTPWSFDLFCSLLGVMCVLRDLLAPQLLLHGHYYIHFVASQRLVWMFLQGNTWAGIATNIIYTACNLCIFHYNFGWDREHFIYESGALIVILFLGRLFHKWTYAEARATIEAETLARSEATVHRLLSAVCDAVVHFGSDCIIRHPCPKLEVLLLKSRTRSSLQGTSFNDFFDACEQERLERFLSSMTNERFRPDLSNQEDADLANPEDAACMIHSHMKDATGTNVPVQIFHGSCRDINEEICHVVGIREDQETVSRMQPTGVPTSVDGGLPPLIEHCITLAKEDASNSPSVPVSYSQPAAEVVAWVDTSTPACLVVRCTPGFSALCGPTAEGTKLQEWISDKKQRKRFRQWVQEAFDTFYHDCDMPTEKLEMEVTLMPPHIKRVKKNFTATVEVAEIQIIGYYDDDDDPSQHIIMQLVFSCISRTRGNASPHRRLRNGSDEQKRAEV